MCRANHSMKSVTSNAIVLAVLLALSFSLLGCERRERVLEVQTPGGGVTVDRVERGDDVDRIEVQTDDR
jgi:hypothetical protein